MKKKRRKKKMMMMMKKEKDWIEGQPGDISTEGTPTRPQPGIISCNIVPQTTAVACGLRKEQAIKSLCFLN